MLYCPLRSPRRASKRLLGKPFRSCRWVASSKTCSRRSAWTVDFHRQLTLIFILDRPSDTLEVPCVSKRLVSLPVRVSGRRKCGSASRGNQHSLRHSTGSRSRAASCSGAGQTHRIGGRNPYDPLMLAHESVRHSSGARAPRLSLNRMLSCQSIGLCRTVRYIRVHSQYESRSRENNGYCQDHPDLSHRAGNEERTALGLR